jgi:hypothetical protein
MALAGLGYMTFLYAPLADYLHPYNLAPGALGETSLILWLLVMGVNAQKMEGTSQHIRRTVIAFGARRPPPTSPS